MIAAVFIIFRLHNVTCNAGESAFVTVGIAVVIEFVFFDLGRILTAKVLTLLIMSAVRYEVISQAVTGFLQNVVFQLFITTLTFNDYISVLGTGRIDHLGDINVMHVLYGNVRAKIGRRISAVNAVADTISLPGFPIVLHGSSSVPQEFVKIINENGGKMPDAVGIPEEQLRQAARGAVCKINIDSDLRLAMTASIRQYFNEHPDHFDPRQYLKPARVAIKNMVEHKLVDVLGCDGKA